MEAPQVKPARKQERFLLRIEKGRGLVPFDEATKDRLNAKGYHMGDVLSATLRKARNPGFHRLVHAFGVLVGHLLHLPTRTVGGVRDPLPADRGASGTALGRVPRVRTEGREDRFRLKEKCR